MRKGGEYDSELERKAICIGNRACYDEVESAETSRDRNQGGQASRQHEEHGVREVQILESGHSSCKVGRHLGWIDALYRPEDGGAHHPVAAPDHQGKEEEPPGPFHAEAAHETLPYSLAEGTDLPEGGPSVGIPDSRPYKQGEEEDNGSGGDYLCRTEPAGSGTEHIVDEETAEPVPREQKENQQVTYLVVTSRRLSLPVR